MNRTSFKAPPRGRCARRGVSMVAALSETDSHPEDLLRVCESSDPQVFPAASNVLTKCSIEVRPVRSRWQPISPATPDLALPLLADRLKGTCEDICGFDHIVFTNHRDPKEGIVQGGSLSRDLMQQPNVEGQRDNPTPEVQG